MSPTATRDADWSARYFGTARREVLPMLDCRGGRVLEIGCGAGATLAFLKERGVAGWTAGIEYDPDAAAHATTRLDACWHADAQSFDPPIEAGSLDAILCLDVLEHLPDPWAVVKRLGPLLRPGGALVASIPNIRYYKVVLPLLFRGAFRYDPEGGIMDATHLRFFVRATAIELAECGGLAVDRVDTLGFKRRNLKGLLNAMTGGALTDLFTRQYLIRAIRR